MLLRVRPGSADRSPISVHRAFGRGRANYQRPRIVGGPTFARDILPAHGRQRVHRIRTVRETAATRRVVFENSFFFF